MNRRTVPADLDAERALIGCALLSERAAADACQAVTPTDFYAPKHQHIWNAVSDLARRHERIDPVVLVNALAGLSDEVGGLSYLLELQNAAPSVSSVMRYASIVVDRSARRAVIMAAAAAADAGYELEAGEAIDRAREAMSAVHLPVTTQAPAPDVDSFIASVPTGHDWLIPDFLERGDRLLVTAAEGGGKSTLLRQMAVQAASGVHPWTWAEVEPRNVLLIDLENGPRMVARRMMDLRAAAGNGMNPQRLRIECRPEGMNLHNRADRAWLYERARTNAAELIVMGPIYKMHAGSAEKGDVGGEDQARSVVLALDELRDMGIAMILETHSPHGSSASGRDLRPFGSSVWLRWPEFGIGLRPVDPSNPAAGVDVEHWRGPRDVRPWPNRLMRGKRWPWTPDQMPTGTFAGHNARGRAS